MENTQIVAIKVKTSSGERFFCRFGDCNQVLTAWSLSGARLFFSGDFLLSSTVHNFQSRGKKITIHPVNCGEAV
ncbi:conserved hypothetical protein [Vibrio aestuarianus]|uniref:hypothetical protein n=1 Tax=Vibrio aestuarianus TaxID=28171 RepID=UPI001455E57F|nr:hypothetical protein [Vibrio aestuarianus]NLS63628.1 hypothetical protein [Vibrio aestuarianus subsp. francensis]CAH8189129.1 conserved hypothetical protein [Vibrio aestuarianus]